MQRKKGGKTKYIVYAVSLFKKQQNLLIYSHYNISWHIIIEKKDTKGLIFSYIKSTRNQ